MSKNVQGNKTDLLSSFSPPSHYQLHHFILHVSTLENDISRSAKCTYTTVNALNSPFNLPQRMHTVLCPSRPQNDVSSSAKRMDATLLLQKPFQPNAFTLLRMYHAPQVFSTVPPCPAPLLAPRRCIVVRKSVPHHPPAS